MLCFVSVHSSLRCIDYTVISISYLLLEEDYNTQS
jgi:hypothetical protein